MRASFRIADSRPKTHPHQILRAWGSCTWIDSESDILPDDSKYDLGGCTWVDGVSHVVSNDSEFDLHVHASETTSSRWNLGVSCLRRDEPQHQEAMQQLQTGATS